MQFDGRKLRVSGTLSRSRVLVTDTARPADLNVPILRGPVIPASLAQDFARFLDVESFTGPIVHLPDGSCALFFHFLGSLWETLRGLLILEAPGKKPIKVNAFSLQSPEAPEALWFDLSTERISAIARQHRRKLGKRLDQGPWATLLAPGLAAVAPDGVSGC